MICDHFVETKEWVELLDGGADGNTEGYWNHTVSSTEVTIDRYRTRCSQCGKVTEYAQPLYDVR